MIKNYFFWVCLIFLGFIIGVWSCAVSTYWTTISPVFYSFKLTEILQLFLTLLIAVFITRYTTSTIHNEQQRKKIVCDRLDFLIALIENIYSKTGQYFKAPTQVEAAEILVLFKRSSQVMLGLLGVKNLKVGNHFFLIKDKLFEFKDEVTGNSFFKTKKHIDSAGLKEIDNKYQLLFEALQNSKLAIFD